MKSIVLFALAIVCFLVGTAVFAASGTNIGGVASNITGNLGAITKLITGGSYVAGIAFGAAGIFKFKAHKDNPTQVPISTGIVYIFLCAALFGLPTLVLVSAKTAFGSGVYSVGSSGVSNFGVNKPTS